MKIKTVKGTNDYLPREVALREYLQNTILRIYRANGFNRIMTPAVEDIENLMNSEGGDNLSLLFKILKRGDKLVSAMEKQNAMEELADLGLRYDLTLPLSRYYANNRQKLVSPFKCIQIDRAYRAERPQRGRMREFIQCDIDIIGSKSVNCEIELILVTAKALMEIGMKDFRVRINDRRILNDLLLSVGFAEESLNSVCISFDKLDKIGVDGLEAELREKGFPQDSIEKLLEIAANPTTGLENIKADTSCAENVENLQKIIRTVTELSEGGFDIDFDLSLIRGQGYYTGTVFEIESKEFKGSIAGGGRYDNLIGKFSGENIPAVGFSIGFERIFSILSENGFVIPSGRKRIAVLYDGDFIAADVIAGKFRAKYDVTLFEIPAKVGKFANALREDGYYGLYICGKSEGLEVL